MHDSKSNKWLIVFLLFLFMSLNLADRAVLGLTAQQLTSELNITPKQFGLIGSSFYLLFSLSTLINGFLVDKFSAKKIIVYMALVWSLAQLPMIFSSSLFMIYLSRIMLGAGEGPAYFVALHATYKFFPIGQRTLPAAIVAQGSAFGLLILLPLLGALINYYSWRAAYVALMISSLIWVGIWSIYGKDGSNNTEFNTVTFVPTARNVLRELIFDPTFFAVIIMSFAANWTFSILTIWFTPYLISGLGIHAATASFISALPWVTGSILSILVSWLAHRRNNGVYSPLLTTRFIIAGSIILGGSALIGLSYATSHWLKIFLATVGTSAPMLVFIFAPTFLSEIVPEQRRGSILGINASIASLAGIISPFAMGSFVQEGATPELGYMRGLFFCGLIMLISGTVGIRFLKIEKTPNKAL